MTVAAANGELAQGGLPVVSRHPLRVLIVEDSTTDTNLIVQALRRMGRSIEFDRVEDEAAMRVALTSRTWDIIVSDWSLPKFSGLRALAVTKQVDLDLPFIIVSGTIGEEMAVDAMRAGVHDYVLKDKLSRLVPAVERELRDSESRRQRKQAEKALAATQQQLHEAQRMEAIGRLAGGVAHTLNDLLSIVLSYSEIALEPHTPGELVRKSVEEIQRAGQRAASLTRQLLAFSRQQVLQPRVLDLNVMINDMDQVIRRLMGAGITYKRVEQPHLGKVKADPGHIEQVVMNLVTNARDAMSNGGSLTIETANVELDEAFAREHPGAVAGPHVLLAVIDTGIGMDKAIRDRIFEPFFTTKEKDKGTGLGLSTVFGIVTQSDGSVWVSSEPGKGTTFKVYLPRTDAAPAVEQHPLPLDIVRGSETILLVEDDSPLRVVLRDVLVRNGYCVLEACDAAAAMRFTSECKDTIHLLLTDVVLPHMSGTQLAERLSFVRPNLRVLYMSGYSNPDHRIIGRDVLESVAYLQKPITPAILARKIREVLAAPIRRSTI